MIEVSKQNVVDGLLGERVYEMYLVAFDKLRAAAIQRHVMTKAEFVAVMADERVVKYVGEDVESGRICALATMSNELESMPLVSPEFFAARWPAQYANDTCFYVGFMAIHPDYQGTGVFVDLVTDITLTVGQVGGIAVMDVCTRNADRFRLPQAVARLANSAFPSAPVLVDQQSFWAYEPVSATWATSNVIDLRDRVAHA